MKTLQKPVSQPDQEQQQDTQPCKQEIQPSSQAVGEHEEEQLHEAQSEGLTTESSPGPISSGDNRKVSCDDIQLVQNLIERCLQLYMNQREVIKTLLDQAKIEPGFTSLVWQKLEEQNCDFFNAYYTRLKLKKQIILFNRLLEQQYQLMRLQVPPTAPLVPIQNGMHPSPVQHLSMGYPVLPQPQLPASGHPHLVSMSCGPSSPAVVNGIPAQGNFQSIPRRSATDNMTDSSMEGGPVMQSPCSGVSSMTDMSLSPGSAMSSGPFPFNSTDISGIGTNLMPLDVPFLSGDTGGPNGVGTLQVVPDVGGGSLRDSLRSLGQLPRNFSLSDLTADLTNVGDLGLLGSYSGSPFLPDDTEVFLESPDNDEIDEEFFIDSITEPCYQSDEGKVG